MKKYLFLIIVALLQIFVCTSAYALDKVGNVYQIGTADDLEEFATLVNGGEVFANAVLTADIDRGVDGTMIGTESKKYQGTFDGKGHTIKIDMYPEVANAALFQYTGFGALIQNLKVQGTITTANKFAAGLVARNYGIIRGCYVDITINSSVPGDATHGGIVAVGYGGTTVENCLAKIAITGETTTNCGGVVGWAEKRSNIVNCLVLTDDCTFAYSDASNGHSSNISRNEGNLASIDVDNYNADPYANRPKGACYNNYVTNQWGDNVATTVVPYAELADGKICFQLNNDQSKIAWVQQIGTDPFPVPAAFGTGQVYASGATDCNGTSAEALTFSNTPSNAITTAHTFDKYGVCTTCGCFDFHIFEFDNAEKFDQADRSVLLKTKEDIDKVEGWNRIAQGFRLNMKMVNDIEYIAEEGHYIFNPSDWIDGNFNGDGHTLTIEMTEMGEKAALFPEMAGNVENLILHGNILTNAARSGSISGNARMALVRNVYSDVNITSTVIGDNCAGGLFGWMGDKEKHVENCIYAGTFTLPGSEGGAHCARVGGIAGWTAAKTYITNCAILGEIIGAGNQTFDDDTENSQNVARNPNNIIAENVYVAHPIFGNAVSDHDKYTHYENEEGIANGELAFLLNSKQNGLARFYQVIGTDPLPMPFKKEGGLVYVNALEYLCDGTPLGSTTYCNTSLEDPVLPDHHNVDGFCTVCGKIQDDFLTPVGGWFEISNGAELSWWSLYCSFHPESKAKLVDDIDMSDYSEKYTPVCNPLIPFVGEFDGQGHTFSNVDISGGDYFGLIGVIGNGAVIKNFVLDKTCSITGNAFCGIIGSTNGSGDIYIDNVGNEGNVATFNQNAAGILGVDMGGSMNLHITNCWTTGIIYGGRESAAICGYSNASSEIINCWSTAYLPKSSIYSSDSFTRGAAKVINCYEADIEGVAPNKQQHVNPMAEDRRANPITPEEVANGALCYKLNGSQDGGENFYQVIGTDPTPMPFAKEGGKVYSQGNSTYANTLPIKQEGSWTDANGTEWYFTTEGSNATITGRTEDDNIIPAISGIIPANLMVPATVYIGESPYKVNAIGERTFWDCTNLTSVTIPDGVTIIGNQAFCGCSNLTSVNIPNGVTSIGWQAFCNCFSLTPITIPDGVTSIGWQAFASCHSLTSIFIPNSVTFIDNGIISGCSGLTSIVVEEGNTKYDSRNNCNAIIETSSNTLIAGCKNTIIPNSVTSIESIAFLSCDGLTSVTIPNSVTYMGQTVFGWCYALTSVIIPNSITNIDHYMFEECGSLSSVTIGSNVQSIGDRVFSGCRSLSIVKIGTATPPIVSSSAFQNSNYKNATLYVPNGSKAAYEAADYWKEFKEIIECNYVNVDEISIVAGESKSFEIGLTNEDTNLVGFQMDLTLPEGVDIDKTGCKLSSRISDKEQELTIGKLESGAYRITSTSLSLTPISGNEGILLTLKITAEEGCVGGQATISNIIFSTSESEKIVMSDESFDIGILYKVIYLVDDEVYKTDEFAYNSVPVLIDYKPTKEGYTFSGWSEMPATMPNHDVTITGSFSANSYELTYMVNGEVYKTESVVYGTTIVPEAGLTKEGYTFSGWSEIPETMPARDVVVTGTFTINYYKLTYIVDGGEYKTLSVVYGTTITPEAEPTKEGYTFGGWSELPETMPAHDVEITGCFYLFGDVNTDEEVDVVDVVDIARFVVAKPSVKFREKLADLNKDNTVNIADAVTLVNHIAGDQNFAKAMVPSGLSYNYDQCQLQLLSAGQNAISLYLDGEADFTAFQFDVDVPEGTDISAIRINGMREDGHQLLYNKVEENRYRVTALSLSNAIFKGNMGKLLQFSINGQITDDICVHDIHFVNTKGNDFTFDPLYLTGVTETGIGSINNEIVNGKSSNGKFIYDLQGRKLSKVQHGVNIINGKKVVNK